jgi:hypothetical protein
MDRGKVYMVRVIEDTIDDAYYLIFPQATSHTHAIQLTRKWAERNQVEIHIIKAMLVVEPSILINYQQ